LSYTGTTWADRNVQFPTYYTEVDIGAGVYSHTPAPGTITEAGTTVTATRMNAIETGITKAHISIDIYNYRNLGGAL
jgi:hypothetical protein